MKCPNCKTDFSDGNRCPKCKIDVALYKRTVLVSHALYNEGLKKAQIMDMSGAISSLEKSLEFNKANADARNLLGLICFETGRIGDAIKHWVLSTSFMKNENLAAHYLDTVQRNSKLVERLNESVLMYNQALAYLHQKSEDLAIIQLKRALEYNPKFIDALNLLSLCYLMQDEKDKAKQMLDRTLAIDSGNWIALHYYFNTFGKVWSERESKTGRMATGRLEVPRTESSKPENLPAPHIKPQFTSLSASDEKSFRNSFHIPEIISFVVGGLCAFAIFYILFLPSEVERRDLEISEMLTNMQANEQMLNNDIEKKNNEIDALTAENNELRASYDKLESEIAVLARVQRVNQLETVYNSGNLEETILLIPGIETAGLPADALEKYENIKNDTYAKYAKLMYDNGDKNYKNKNYEAARTEFETCIEYAPNTLGLTDNAIYLLAVMAHNAEDFDTAKRYYQIVVDVYPESSRITYARNGLNQLQ